MAKTAVHWMPEGKRKRGAPLKDHVATDGRQGNKGDGKDQGSHSDHGKEPIRIDVEGTRCWPTCDQGIKGVGE